MTPLELHQSAERLADSDLELRRLLNASAPDLKAMLRLQAKQSAELMKIARHLADDVAP